MKSAAGPTTLALVWTLVFLVPLCASDASDPTAPTSQTGAGPTSESVINTSPPASVTAEPALNTTAQPDDKVSNGTNSLFGNHSETSQPSQFPATEKTSGNSSSVSSTPAVSTLTEVSNTLPSASTLESSTQDSISLNASISGSEDGAILTTVPDVQSTKTPASEATTKRTEPTEQTTINTLGPTALNASTSSDSDVGPTTTVTTGTEPSPSTTTTPRRRITVDVDDVVMKSTPTTRRLILVLRGNCSHDNLRGDIEQAFRYLSPVENLNVTDIQCSTLLDVNITLKAGEIQLKQLLRNLSLSRIIQVGDSSNQFVLTDFSVKEQVSTDGARSTRPRWVPTHEELIIYIAVGVLFAIVLMIAFVVCSIRCCRRQPSKTLDFLETPRLNLRLEDYTLTRIPRPHTVYADHLRTPDQEVGVVQAFDTCVVPLENVEPITSRHDDWKNQQLRTFGRPRTSPSGGRLVVRKTPTEEDDDDEYHRESLKSCRGLSTSTEKLARRDPDGRHGVDNPIYFSDRRKSKG